MSGGPSIKGAARIYCQAGAAKPNPKIGQALGPLGLNMMEFCKQFNARTGHFRSDVPMRVLLTAYADRTFTFHIRPPPSAYMIKKAAGLPKASQQPGHHTIGRVGIKYLYEIAKVKQELDDNLVHHDLEGITSMLVGQCLSMGIDVVEDTLPTEPMKIDV